MVKRCSVGHKTYFSLRSAGGNKDPVDLQSLCVRRCFELDLTLAAATTKGSSYVLLGDHLTTACDDCALSRNDPRHIGHLLRFPISDWFSSIRQGTQIVWWQCGSTAGARLAD